MRSARPPGERSTRGGAAATPLARAGVGAGPARRRRLASVNLTPPAQLVAVLGRGVVPSETAVLVADDLGVTRGDGCFDAMRLTRDADGTRLHHRAGHLARFGRSAARLEIAEPPAPAAWDHLIDEAVAAWDEPGEAIVKLVLTRGRESFPTAPSGYLTITAAPDYSTVRRGVTAVSLDRGYRSDAFADAAWLLGGVKTLSYAGNVAVRREASRRGADEAVYRSSDGYLLEGPTSGLVFALEDRLWTTPPGSTGILESVTVAAIFDIAERNGVDTGEALFTVADAQASDGMWLVSAIRGVLPVLELDGRTLNHDPEVTSVLSVAGGFPALD